MYATYIHVYVRLYAAVFVVMQCYTLFIHCYTHVYKLYTCVYFAIRNSIRSYTLLHTYAQVVYTSILHLRVVIRCCARLYSFMWI